MRLQKGFDPVVNTSRPEAEEAPKNLFFVLARHRHIWT